MKTMYMLLRRELWESPIAFKWTPVGITLLILLMVVMSMIFAREIDPQSAFTLDSIRLASDWDAERRGDIMAAVMYGVSGLFSFIMFFVIVFYLAGSLYDDRKDRSILFWKSLPISDTQTVLSKLLTACLLIPACFLAATLVTHILLLLIATGYAAAAGVSPWTTFWAPASLPSVWTTLVLAHLVQALWMLPIYGWLLFCSSWAPRLPILIALGVPLLLGMMQNFYSWLTAFRFPDPNIVVLVLYRFGQGVLPLSMAFTADGEVTNISATASISTTAARLTGMNLWLGVLIGVIFIAGAIWFRRRATDN